MSIKRLPTKLGTRAQKDADWWLSKRLQQLNPPSLDPFSYYKNLEYPEWYQVKQRNTIRQRDSLTCQICSAKGTNKTLHVHHINYLKNDCKELNLIALCKDCHRRTNWNRQQWYRVLFKQMKERQFVKD